MIRWVKCAICNKDIDKGNAYCVEKHYKTGRIKKSYYCSEEEYINNELNKKYYREIAILIDDILGYSCVIKKKKDIIIELEENYTRKQILDCLKEYRDEIKECLDKKKIENSWGQLCYIYACLNNKIKDFVDKKDMKKFNVKKINNIDEDYEDINITLSTLEIYSVVNTIYTIVPRNISLFLEDYFKEHEELLFHIKYCIDLIFREIGKTNINDLFEKYGKIIRNKGNINCILNLLFSYGFMKKCKQGNKYEFTIYENKIDYSQGEEKIKNVLIDLGIYYWDIIYDEPYFNDLLGLHNKPLRPDFIIESKKIWIEYDGEQHFRPIAFNDETEKDANKKFKILQEHDKRKNEYAKKHGWKLIRIPYTEYNNIEDILKDII